MPSLESMGWRYRVRSYAMALWSFSPSTAWTLRGILMDYRGASPFLATLDAIYLEWSASLRCATPELEE